MLKITDPNFDCQSFLDELVSAAACSDREDLMALATNFETALLGFFAKDQSMTADELLSTLAQLGKCWAEFTGEEMGDPISTRDLTEFRTLIHASTEDDRPFH